MAAVKVFLSYAHQDEEYKNELLEFLAPMKDAGLISVWNDREIYVGDQWNDEILNALNESQIILFLLSSSFLASSYINKVEIVRAMHRHYEDPKVRLVPIMLRNCDMASHIIPDEKYTIKDFQGLPTNLKPVNKWPDRDDAWMNIVNELRRVIKTLHQEMSTKNQ